MAEFSTASTRGTPRSRWPWDRRGCHIAGVLVTLISAVLSSTEGNAQTLRLTVRPRHMVTATRTPHGGELEIGGNRVYVPVQCVGERRCPLIVYSNFINSPEILTHIADAYGMIVANAGSAVLLSALASDDSVGDSLSVVALDQFLTAVLQTVAIDLDKIAILGGSATGVTTARYGADNQDIFSRVALFTQQDGNPPVRTHQTTEYYISGGLLENWACFEHIQRLRDLGYPVNYMLQFRPHENQYEDNDFLGHWLQESWAIPNRAARPAMYTFGQPPLLTAAIMAQMTDFWTRFMREPDSIRTAARRKYMREVIVPVGNQRIGTLMTDMAVFAAHYPAVAQDLKVAGLTPQQHDSYRAALFGVRVEQSYAKTNCPRRFPTTEATIRSARLVIDSISTLAKNIQFIRAHSDAADTLSTTNMWSTP